MQGYFYIQVEIRLLHLHAELHPPYSVFRIGAFQWLLSTFSMFSLRLHETLQIRKLQIFVMAFPLNTLMSSPADAPTTHIIKAAHGFAFEVKRGERFRVVDLYGEQVVDFAAWVRGTALKEKLSMAYTRYHLAGATPMIGEYLWTNLDRPILKLVEDTVKIHDMTFVSE